MAKEFDVGFLGLTGSIDEETAKAIFRGDFDITAQAPDTTNYSEQDRRVFEIAKRVLNNRWNEEMRNQGITAKPSDFSNDHPPTLLRNKNAEVLAALSTELHPEMLKIVDSILSEGEECIDDAVEPDEDLFGELTDQVLSQYAEAIVSGISEALDESLHAPVTLADIKFPETPVDTVEYRPLFITPFRRDQISARHIACQPVDPLSHFVGRLVSKCHTENMPRHDPETVNKICKTCRESLRLTASSSRNDAYVPFGCGDRFPL